MATENLGVVDDRIVRSRDQLVQADPLHELRPRVDQRDVHARTSPQAIGRDHPGVSTADDDHSGVLLAHHISPLR
jgi:hypothetical protein